MMNEDKYKNRSNVNDNTVVRRNGNSANNTNTSKQNEKKSLKKYLEENPKKYISKLKETGKIVRIGPPTYGGQWKILE